MNPTNVKIVIKPVIIITSGATEKPLNSTNQFSVM
jgi:hypothetical protein